MRVRNGSNVPLTCSLPCIYAAQSTIAMPLVIAGIGQSPAPSINDGKTTRKPSTTERGRHGQAVAAITTTAGSGDDNNAIITQQPADNSQKQSHSSSTTRRRSSFNRLQLKVSTTVESSVVTYWNHTRFPIEVNHQSHWVNGPDNVS